MVMIQLKMNLLAQRQASNKTKVVLNPFPQAYQV